MSKDKDFKIEENNEAVNNGNAEEENKNGAENGTTAAQEDAGETENGATDNTADKQEEEKTPLEIAEEEVAVLKDKYLRSVAEFDNYRKRTLKEKTELILNGSEKAVTAILPILDDMERAIENSAKTDDPAVLKEGMELILQKFIKALEGMGVKKIDTADADFNTDFHEAIAMVPGMGDDKKGKVLDCVQTGYMLNDKVIRHAKVAVGQ
ncbi:MAG: nucleotide exchange factor GrpE [Prevotella sp.]|nr:nucleotide exchange factor GrpE [Prevotella sp.]